MHPHLRNFFAWLPVKPLYIRLYIARNCGCQCLQLKASQAFEKARTVVCYTLFAMDDHVAELPRCHTFEQVSCSMDGHPEAYSAAMPNTRWLI